MNKIIFLNSRAYRFKFSGAGANFPSNFFLLHTFFPFFFRMTIFHNKFSAIFIYVRDRTHTKFSHKNFHYFLPYFFHTQTKEFHTELFFRSQILNVFICKYTHAHALNPIEGTSNMRSIFFFFQIKKTKA